MNREKVQAIDIRISREKFKALTLEERDNNSWGNDARTNFTNGIYR